MKKLAIINLLAITALTACSSMNEISSTRSPANNCPADAPLFTPALAAQLTDQWFDSFNYYVKNGTGGYQDPYIAAAYHAAAEFAPDAVLMPALSSTSKIGSQAIYEYHTRRFNHNSFLISKAPEEIITSATCGSGVVSGYIDSKQGAQILHVRYTLQFEYLANPNTVSFKITGGPKLGTLKTITSPAGWYIRLQNATPFPSAQRINPKVLLD